jgi:hypothetical protein
MYGYAASALRFSLINTVSCVTSDWKVVGYPLHFGLSRDFSERNRGAFGCFIGRASLPKWYEVWPAESNPKSKWVPHWIRNPGSMKEAVGFLHPIDATAVMRGSSDLPCSTRSVC